MIFITGDMHGDHDISKFSYDKFKEGKNLTKNDYVIICGDFGLIWSNDPKDPTERYWTKWLDERPWKTFFADGNHENFPRLLSYPEVDMFEAKVGKITDSIFHLKRGNIYTIEEKTFFVMGGATSTDKQNRKEFISWWKEELPNHKEYQFGLDNLSKVNYKVDYVITHMGPEDPLILKGYSPNDSIIRYFTTILNSDLQFKRWYFGHLHDDFVVDNYTCLYDKIERVI